MLHLYSSNRLEPLLEILATLVTTPLPNPLDQEIIVVQSQGMERWIAMQLAQRLGVWANSEFPFPETMLWRIFKDILGYSRSEQFKFNRETLLWMFMTILPQFLTTQPAAATELHNYLQDQPSIKYYQLSTQLADSFDQYLIYRPDWIQQWEAASCAISPPHWQALLWHTLTKHYGNRHWTRLRTEFLQKLQRLTSPPPHLPKRFSVFGIAALPPFYLEVFTAIARLTEIHIFLLDPCQEYWGDIFSDTDIARKIARLQGKLRTPDDQHLEKGNSLLASMGKLGRDFIDQVIELAHSDIEEQRFESPGETTLLTCIQSDILQLRESSTESASRIIAATDKSIQIQAAHSPMREVEILHDQLLAWFEENPTLQPKDVLVMLPDIEKYAAFIQAVFATTPATQKKIPFSLADRSLRQQSQLIDTCFAILELQHSRFSVSEVLTILEVPAVQRRFDLVTADLELIRYWIEQTEIRWGVDGHSRTQMGLPGFEENTWRAGLKRLLLGYALSHHSEEHLFEDILPFTDLEGGETLILGKLAAFVENLFEYVHQLSTARSLTDWAELLNRLLTRFFRPAEDQEAELQPLRKVLATLIESGQRANFQTVINSEVIVAHLRHHLEMVPQPINFLTGQVTFCTLLPMRSIPFKIICLLGMDDRAYPRPTKTLGFDLIAQHPQRGDRSRRQNDRYLFLEALLSARQYFYLSYVGHSIHDNTEMPPSVLISELQDYISKGFKHPAYSNILDYLVTHHPLQAFSPRYFNHSDKRLFSFSAEYCTASNALLKKRQTVKFIKSTLPAPTAEWKTISLEQLIKFFTHPIQFLLKERLGIYLTGQSKLLAETEPFEIQGLERYSFNQILVEKSLQGHDLIKYQTIAKARGQLPQGQIGEQLYHNIIEEIQPFIYKVQQATQQAKAVTRPLNLTIEGMRITGHLNSLWQTHLIHYRYVNLKAKDHIRLWLHHLILNCLTETSLPRHSLLIGKDDAWEYPPIPNSQEILASLLRLYWQGLQRPLLFFPESALVFAEEFSQSLKEGKNEEVARKMATTKAAHQWLGKNSSFAPGENQDEYYQLCFGHQVETVIPLQENEEEFKQIAMQFFEPLLKSYLKCQIFN